MPAAILKPARITPPLKWPGGKHYLANKLIDLMPRHVHYVEPFAGGLSVLMHRDPDDETLWLPPHKGVSEVVNDRYGQLMNFWRVVQDPKTFARFRRQVEAIPLSRQSWEEARAWLASRDLSGEPDPIADAVAFFVRCRQSRSGTMQSFTPLTRSRTRRRMNGNVSEWLGAVEGLPAVHDRLRRVAIENRPAIEVIQREDGPGTLFYCDPPYLHSTRNATAVYAHEMTEAEHRELRDALRQVEGKVMLSGYPSELYDTTLHDWTRHTFDLPNHASGSKTKDRETEVVWCNF